MMMKLQATRVAFSVAALLLTGAGPMPTTPAARPSNSAVWAAVRGEYVEVRTASVFAGACHYNGERVTEGRSAVLAFRIDGGGFGGVDLGGVRAVAAVSCDENLAEPAAARTAEVRVDAATDAQAAAAVAWLQSRPGRPLGEIRGVARSAVTFRHDADADADAGTGTGVDAGAFAVSAAGFASLSVRPMPDAACCSQPQLVWYTPLVPTETRRVGYTESARYTGPGSAWQRSDENSAFYGRLAP